MAKAMIAHKDWRRQKMQEIIAYMRRDDVIPMPLVCAEACGITRYVAQQWLEAGSKGDPEYEFYARTAIQIRAKYIQKLMQELLDPACSSPAQKARQFMLQKLSREDFEPPPLKAYAASGHAALPAPEDPIEATVEFLSLPVSKD